jgi:hypothetical protein
MVVYTNSQWKIIQTKLKSLKFYSGVVDGIAGPVTIAAVKAFQKSKGLLVDGIVGPITLKALGINFTIPAPVTYGPIQKEIIDGTGRTFTNFTGFYNLVKSYCDYAYYYNGQYSVDSEIHMIIADINGAAKGLNCVDYTQIGVKLAREMGYIATPYGIRCVADGINHAIFLISGKEFTSSTWIDLAAAASSSYDIGRHWCSGALTKTPSWIPYE